MSFYSSHRTVVLLATVLLLLAGHAAARQLDGAQQHAKYDDKALQQEGSNGALSHSQRSLSWGHSHSNDGAAGREQAEREYGSFPNEEQYQTYSRNGAMGEHEHDRSGQWSDAQQYKGYDQQYKGYDQQYKGYDQQYKGYDQQYERRDQQYEGRDQQRVERDAFDRNYDRMGERDVFEQNYDRMGERDEPSYRTYDVQENRDRGYIQYGSDAGRQYNDRGEMYQQYGQVQGERDQDGWQRADSRWQQDRMGPYHDQHSHGSHDEGASPGNATVNGDASRDHCAQHKPTAEEKVNLQKLLSEAATWWDDFSDEIEEWLEEHGNVVSDWLDENVLGLFDDGTKRDAAADGAAGGKKKFNARVKVYWTAVVPKNGSVDGFTGKLAHKDVEEQIQVMNTAFKGAGFQFVLESFKSVKHTPAEFTACTEDADPNTVKIKTRYRKGDATDLYIYTWLPRCETWTPLGWATFPEWYTESPEFDGVVLLYTSLPGGKTKNYNRGMTAVHEVGHWLGLYHTFGDGCSDEVNDEVADTPTQLSPTEGCPKPTPDTCPNQKGLDPIHNYMDYSYDVCMNQFTPGQVKRMQNAWKLRVKMSKQS